MDRRMINELRAFNFILSVMEDRLNDPLCGRCTAYARTLGALRDGFIKFETDFSPRKKELPEEYREMFRDVYDMISLIGPPEEEPVAQKKAGNCLLPEGVCFTKAPMELFKRAAG